MRGIEGKEKREGRMRGDGGEVFEDGGRGGVTDMEELSEVRYRRRTQKEE